MGGLFLIHEVSNADQSSDYASESDVASNEYEKNIFWGFSPQHRVREVCSLENFDWVKKTNNRLDFGESIRFESDVQNWLRSDGYDVFTFLPTPPFSAGANSCDPAGHADMADLVACKRTDDTMEIVKLSVYLGGGDDFICNKFTASGSQYLFSKRNSFSNLKSSE
jgi:hypothetical protein